jgi:hypothetical protein
MNAKNEQITFSIFNAQSLRTAILNEWSIWSVPGLFFHDQQSRTDPDAGSPMPDH